MKKILEVAPPHAPPYPVWCGSDVAAGIRDAWSHLGLGGSPAVLIGDEHTDALFGDTLARELGSLGAPPLRLAMGAGEVEKTRATKERIEDAMLAAGLDRGTCVVAVGGGVVLDLAGFVAATFKRGIDHILVATTLLAQVDAAIGGKTAVNTAHGKNLIGAFHHPRAVVLHTGALDSLPPDELRAGLAELIKHAVLRDADLFSSIESWSRTQLDLRPPDEAIARAVAIKADIVGHDDKDQGLRHVLNFGHTVAHAIEHASEHAMSHGHAVAVGMVVEARLACDAGRFPPEDLARLVALLEALGLPTSPTVPFARAEPALVQDKKREAGVVRCAIPRRIGEIGAEPDGRWTVAVDRSALERAWESTRCSA